MRAITEGAFNLSFHLVLMTALSFQDLAHCVSARFCKVHHRLKFLLKSESCFLCAAYADSRVPGAPFLFAAALLALAFVISLSLPEPHPPGFHSGMYGCFR